MLDKTNRKINKEPIVGIYSVVNKLNGKIYIGQSINIERRWEQHKYGKGNLILMNSIKKHGIKNFEFKNLEQIDVLNKTKLEIVEELTKLEQKWFDDMKPFLKENGYNIQKTSKPNLTPNRDKHYGEKISKIKIDNNHTGKPVCQYDFEGKLINEWKSAAEIERSLGYKAENISASCLNKSNSSNGYIWKFKNYLLTQNDILNANNSLRLSKVRQYNLNGELLKEFKNTKETFEITGIKETIIRNACNGTTKTGGGYIWKFKNQPLILSEHIKIKL